MSETKNIVILGASWAGLGAAHYTFRHILPRLNTSKSKAYHVYLVAPSSQLFWRVGCPREMVSPKITPSLHEGMFLSVTDGFKQYDQSTFTFLLGAATSMDTTQRNVTITMNEGGEEQVLPYHALIIATGSKTPTAATSLYGPHTVSQAALKDMQNKIAAKPRTIILGGGGPVAVETAGEIGEYLNGAPGWLASRPKQPKAKITIITGGKKLLPILRPALGKQAEELLNRVGVDVVYGKYIKDTFTGEDGKTKVTLDNGETLTCDLYIPATGAYGAAEFVPSSLKNEKGYVKTNHSTLRVDAAGPRVYCVGDVGDHTGGGILQIYDTVPIVMHNVKKDLLEDRSTPDKIFKRNTKESQICPVGQSKGVGAFMGYKTPSLMVYMIKGRDYMVGNAKNEIMGTRWVKEA